MKYEIDDAIVNTANKCKNNHVCLEDTIPLCSVEHCLMHRIHYVKCIHEESCSYKDTMEHFTICTCPVRTEIYNKYNI